MITQDELRSLLDYDQVAGIFKWRKTMGGRAIKGDIAGTRHPNGYIRITVKQKFYYAHRLAWLYVHGAWPPIVVDHIDGDPANNSMKNLRLATYADNLANRGPQVNNTSGHKGVWLDKRTQRWVAEVWRNGKKTHAGRFDTPEEAARAYARAHAELAGEFAWLYRGGKL